MILVTFRTIALGQALSTITEWRPQDFSHLGAFELIMLAGFGVALYRGVKLPPLRILMVFGVLHLSLSQSRHADLFGLLAPLFLARPLAEQFGLAASRIAADARIAGWTAATAGMLLIAVTGLAAARHDMRPAAKITPANAVQSLDIAKAGPFSTNTTSAAISTSSGFRPSSTAAPKLYGAAFTMRHDRALKLENLPDFLRLLDEYKIGDNPARADHAGGRPARPIAGLAARLFRRHCRRAHTPRSNRPKLIVIPTASPEDPTVDATPSPLCC